MLEFVFLGPGHHRVRRDRFSRRVLPQPKGETSVSPVPLQASHNSTILGASAATTDDGFPWKSVGNPPMTWRKRDRLESFPGRKVHAKSAGRPQPNGHAKFEHCGPLGGPLANQERFVF